MRRNVLLIYMDKHSGHAKVAEAVKEAFTDVTNHHLHLLPLMETLYSWMKPLSKIHWCIRTNLPSLYNHLWRNDNLATTLNNKRTRLILGLFSKKVTAYFMQYKPDAIVFTHAFPSYLTNKHKECHYISIVTDYEIHPYWMNDIIDYYFVPTEEVKNKLLSWGKEEKKIFISGIPIRKSVLLQEDRDKICKEFGLRGDLPTILLMSGSQGIFPFDKIAKALKLYYPEVQLILLTGKNTRMYNKLIKLKSKGLVVLKYYHQMYKIYSICDVAITKCGAVTITELLARNIPIIVFGKLPGQENYNLSYFLARNLISYTRDINELIPLVKKELSSPAKILTNPVSNLNAAETIATKLVELLRQ